MVPADSPVFKIPPLGTHYSEQWIAEDQKEVREASMRDLLDFSGTRAASRRAQSLIRDQSHADSREEKEVTTVPHSSSLSHLMVGGVARLRQWRGVRKPLGLGWSKSSSPGSNRNHDFGLERAVFKDNAPMI